MAWFRCSTINSDLNLKKVVVLSQQSSGWGKMNRNLYWSVDTAKYPGLTVNNFYVGVSQISTQIYNEGTANVQINKEYSNGTLHVWAGGVYAGEFTCQPIMVV